MLTIRHIESNGHESITTAASVTYDSGDSESSGHPGIRGVTALGGGDADHPDAGNEFQTGEVFVMNDRGATVAVYRNLGLFDNELRRRHYVGAGERQLDS